MFMYSCWYSHCIWRSAASQPH